MLRCFPLVGEIHMSRVCQVTGRKPRKGRTYSIRGIAKKKKGIGLNITGKNKRRFQPNLMKKRLWFAEEKRFITLKLSSAALRTIDKKGLSTIIREMRAKGQKV
ncbi:MAG: 50S ribosomal protein L28 [Chlamydiales bacterium]|nr:50S ribosomal protein L28 [Chlamydiales bacterium]MCH9620217.1 50S ribosomal protein L28 [Chlamydiales bacterium]MCH9623068.1 50S ribosomal protein L28 [Chlamydiales bacterium]